MLMTEQFGLVKQQFYAIIVGSMFIGCIWAAMEMRYGANVPLLWLRFDIIAVMILSGIFKTFI